MIDSGILNRQLLALMSQLGHTDSFCICDAGLPTPNGVPVVDLALCQGVPELPLVLQKVLEQFTVEEYTVASELKKNNPTYAETIDALLAAHPYSPKKQVLTHEDFKEETKNCKFIVRTGDFHAYANVILYSASSDNFVSEK